MNKVLQKNQIIFSKIVDNISKKQTNVQGYILCCTDEKTLDKYSIYLSKILICNGKYDEKCNNCNICERIDNNNYPELKIINPINGVIKKEEILSLKSDFSKSSIEGKNLVYVINNAELLNSFSSNAILKFLEEPDGNVIGIFTTTNINLMYDTIVSRCQIIRLNKENEENIYNLLSEDDAYYVVSFIEKIETDYELAMSEIKEKLIKKFDSREKIGTLLNLFLKFYKECLDYKILNEIRVFSNYENVILNIANQDIEKITKKISFILENIKKIDYNVNIQLFIANFVIGMGELNGN